MPTAIRSAERRTSVSVVQKSVVACQNACSEFTAEVCQPLQERPRGGG